MDKSDNPGQVLVASYQMTDDKDPADFDELKWGGLDRPIQPLARPV